MRGDAPTYTLIKVNNIGDPRLYEEERRAWRPGITFEEIAEPFRKAWGGVVVYRDGDADIVRDYRACVRFDDIVRVAPEIHHAALAGLFVALGASAAVAATLASITIGVSIMIGGMLVQSLLSSSPNVGSSAEKSPTYGFDDINPIVEGSVPPVNWGDTRVTPPLLNEYLEVDNDTSDMIYHGLYCVGQGEHDGAIVAADIRVNNEKLTAYKNYTIASTIGSNTPASGSLPSFAKLHHYRSWSYELKYGAVAVSSLLHFEGGNGSTTITDEGGKTWTCEGDAALTTTNPFVGSACLECPASGDAVVTSVDSPPDWDAVITNWSSDATIEFRALMAGIVDRGFIGGQYVSQSTPEGLNIIILSGTLNGSTGSSVSLPSAVDAVDDYDVSIVITTGAAATGSVWVTKGLSSVTVYCGESNTVDTFEARIEYLDPQYSAPESFWGLTYQSGALTFEFFRATAHWGGIVYESLASVSGAATLEADVWTHICIMARKGQIGLYVGGVLVASGAFEATGLQYILSAQFQIGYAYALSGSSVEYLAAACNFDEFRAAKEALYIWEGFTPPTSALDLLESDASQSIDTDGVCDGSVVVIACNEGLYSMSDTGELRSRSISVELAYRLQDGTTWTTQTVTLTDASRHVVRRQFTLTYPARGKYRVRLTRLSEDDNALNASSRSWWVGMDELLDAELLYPNYHCLDLTLRADESIQGSRPNVAVIARRNSLTVPTYDGTSTQVVSAQTPGWAAYDALTSDLYGGGVDPATRIDPISHAEWIAWTEAVVYDTYKRALCNGTIDTIMTLQSALQYFYDVGRANQMDLGIRIAWAIEKPAQEKRVFGNRNVVVGSENLRFIPITDRSDVIQIKYRDLDQDYADCTVAVPSSTYRTLTRPARTTTIELRLCNNYEQALREGRLRMNLNEMLKRSASFKAGWETINFLPGHVVRFEHDGSRLTYSGAVLAVSGTQVTLDQAILLDSITFEGNCQIWISTCTDELLEANITGPWDEETNVVDVDVALSGVNADGAPNFDPYMIARGTVDVSRFRIMDIARPTLDAQTKTLETVCEGLEYKDEVYYRSEYGAGLVVI